MAQQNGFETGIVDPLKPFFGICFLVVVSGIEAVRLKSSAGVENKDLEHGFAESIPLWPMFFCKSADHQVQLFYVFGLVSVHFFESLHNLLVVGKVFEGANRIESQLAPEVVVSRHAPLARP